MTAKSEVAIRLSGPSRFVVATLGLALLIVLWKVVMVMTASTAVAAFAVGTAICIAAVQFTDGWINRGLLLVLAVVGAVVVGDWVDLIDHLKSIF